MISIAICDDDPKDTDFLYHGLTSFFTQYEDVEYLIECYQDLDSLNKNIGKYQILFLDIQLGTENGVAYAKQLREDGNDISIILVSSSHDYLKEGYRIKALRYITKPYTYEELEYEMKEICSELQKQYAFIQLAQLPIDRLYIRTILFIEVFQHITELHTTFGTYKLRLSLKEWESLLEKYPFTKSSKSFLVHLLYVEKINQAEVVLRNNQFCPLTRRYKKQFLEEYYRYLSDL